MKKKSQGRGRWIVVLLTVIVVGGALTTLAVTRSHVSIDKSKLAAVERGNLAKSVVATGKIEPLTRVELKSRASGIIKSLLVNVGDTVKEGQIVAELDKEQLIFHVRDLEAQVQGAEANLKTTQANYERNKIDAEGPDVPFLKKNQDRSQQMEKDGLLARATVEDAERNYVLALNKQQSGVSNLAVSKAQIAQAAAQLASAKQALEVAKQDLEYATARAPITGVVLSRDCELGDAVSSILVLGSQATLIMTLGDMQEVYVKGKVDESDVGKIYQDQTARITVESFKDKKFFGKVTRISPMGVEKENVTTFEVRVSIENKTGELKALMTANAEIVLEEHKNVLMVPEAAIIYGKDRSATVEVPDPQAKSGKRVVAVKVVLGNGSKTEVTGLNEGQEVVLQ